MNTRPITLITPTARPSPVRAAARHPGGVVGRAEQSWLGADVLDHFLLGPDVIARGHHVDARFEKRVADVLRDAETGGRVLRIGDDEIGIQPIDEPPQSLADDFAARLSDDVADEEDLHAGWS
jgi:hypothetical protein